MNRKCDFSNSEQVFNRGEVMIEIIVIGLIQTGWLLWKINYSKRIKKNYKGRVIAKVIDVKEYVLHIKGRGKVHAYYPTYQYSVNGIVYEKRSSWGYYDKLRYPLGSEIVMYYDEKKPQRSAVGGRMEEELREDNIRRVAFVTGLYWLMVLFGIYVRFSPDFQ